MAQDEHVGEAGREPPPEWAGFFGSAERYERFEACVRVYFKGKGQRVMISEGTVSGGDLGEMRLGLMNVGQLCAAAPEGEWPVLIAGHFDRLGAGQRESKELESQIADYALIGPRLGVRLFEPGHLGPVGEVAVMREDIPGLVSVLCVDMPSTVQTLKREQVEEWGVDDEELFERAMQNLEGLVDAEPEEVDFGEMGRCLMLGGESFFNASLLLVLDRYEGLVGTHGAFVSAPTRNVSLVLPFDDASAMQTCAALMAVTEGMERDGPGSLSRRVWWTRKGEWLEIPYEIAEEGVNVRAPAEFSKILEELAGDQ